jgi:hypothetical protein
MPYQGLQSLVGWRDPFVPNDSHSAFADRSCVGGTMNPQVQLLITLVSENIGKFCCGLAVDWRSCADQQTGLLAGDLIGDN